MILVKESFTLTMGRKWERERRGLGGKEPHCPEHKMCGGGGIGLSNIFWRLLLGALLSSPLLLLSFTQAALFCLKWKLFIERFSILLEGLGKIYSP